MRKLILVKHALPDVVPDVPADRWRLSEKGRLLCGPLVEKLAAYDPVVIAASAEPKAAETGKLVAGHFQKPLEIVASLYEHDRRNVGFLPAREFERSVARLFEFPDERVFGLETAAGARDRFGRAVESILAKHLRGDIVVVAHGTVIALFVAHRTGEDPFPLWKRLGLPSFVVLSLPEYELLETVERVE